MTGQLSPALPVRPGMNEHILEAARQRRLTTEELLAEGGERGVRACLCGPGELCFCHLVERDTTPQNAEDLS